ncbi:MAG: hypothetical protein ACRDK2_01600 [Solirubrobacteraceae bacterium]
MEFSWELGPDDGRYLLRESADAQATHVVVLNTLIRRPTRGRFARSRSIAPEPEPARLPLARATIIDAVAADSQHHAQAWLKDLDPERQSAQATAALNRVLYAHRIATADPYVHEIYPAQAIVIRVGFGAGEQVADGHFHTARELPSARPHWQRRASALRPQERLSVLLGARGQTLICEELTLRARLDFDQGRLELAALELDRAYTRALQELRDEQRPDLQARIEELERHRGAVEQLALSRQVSDLQDLRQPLERLEAALRARTAVGFQQQR